MNAQKYHWFDIEVEAKSKRQNSVVNDPFNREK